MAQNTRAVITRYEGFCRKSFSIGKLALLPKEVEEFANMFREAIEPNELSSIAYQTFMLSHDIIDVKKMLFSKVYISTNLHVFMHYVPGFGL